MHLLRLAAMAAALSLLLVSLISTVSATHDITKELAKYPELSQFCEALNKTHLAAEINRRQTITVLALDNAAMGALNAKGLSLPTLRNVLSLHVLVDYFGAKKLHEIEDGTTLVASMYQSTGDADGNSGYVNITDLNGGKVAMGPADSTELNSHFVKSVLSKPYEISILQISQALDSAQAEAPAPEPSSTNLTSILADKGCKVFAKKLSDTGADKTYQENIDSGLTVLCVGDGVMNAFLPKYNNLTSAGKTSLMLYHALPVYNSMSMFKSNNGAINTLATNGNNKYDLNVQNIGESVSLKTKINTAKVTGTLVDKDPLAVYKIDKVLLPRELFKKEASEAPAPAPEAEAPDAAAEPDSSEDDAADKPSYKKKKNAGVKISGSGLILAAVSLCYGLLAFL